MSFIKREIDLVQRAMKDPIFEDRYDELYAIQQALSWALEPDGFRSPYQMLTGHPISQDCAPPVDCSKHIV